MRQLDCQIAMNVCTHLVMTPLHETTDMSRNHVFPLPPPASTFDRNRDTALSKPSSRPLSSGRLIQRS